MKYRAEIDGLRALAVLPVIFFHAGFDWFNGGFVGVDIFFVISGYLITTIIITEMADKKFSIVNFYERRARRILPALFFVMGLCIPFAYLFMLPDPLENFGQSLVSTSFFANNILLYITAGYWDLSSEFKPLLHTWSLAVEEQFYVFYPLLLIFMWRTGKAVIITSLLLIIFLSLFYAHSGLDRDLAFYSLHTRAFELLLGALMCSFFLGENYLSKVLKNILSLIGFGMIIISILLFDEHTPFPSFYTLMPVIGTCLIIRNGDKTTLVGTILSAKYLVLVGLVSYSAYLFHQPLFSYLRIVSINPPNVFDYFIAIILTFIFAVISYKYIESPFRKHHVISKKHLWSFVGSGMIFFSIVGLYLNNTSGIPGRYSENISPLEKSHAISSRVWGYKSINFDENELLNILVIGNSYGRDIANIILETYDENNFNLIYRDDITTCSMLNVEFKDLLKESSLIIFGSSYEKVSCNESLSLNSPYKDKTYFIGNKFFGNNLNWIMRVDMQNRKYLRNPINENLIENENMLRKTLPNKKFISLFDHLVNENGVLITDHNGMLISDDREHLTLSGTKYVGENIFKNSVLNKYFLASKKSSKK